MTGLIAFLLKIGFKGAVDKALRHMERRALAENNRARIEAMTAVELAKAAVEEARLMTEFNRAKLHFPWFWIFAALFLGPLGLWWAAVIVDSVFGFAWSVADLPTPKMQEWAGQMITWVFYVGTGVGALKAIK